VTEHVEPRRVVGKDGLHGVIVQTRQTDERLGAQVLVQFADGPLALVPAAALMLQDDGSYYLPIAREELERQASRSRSTREELVVPVVEEELRVGKRQVETGKVRIRKQVKQREELVDELLISEQVEVERVAVNAIVDAPVAPRHEGDTLIIPLFEEVLVVEKRLMLREELHVRMLRQETRDPQRVTLRSEDVVVERLDPQGRERAVNE
jgi:uncharacterized protein (TIGR02271 family)